MEINVGIRKATTEDIGPITKLHSELSTMHDKIDSIHAVGSWSAEEYKTELAKKLDDENFIINVAEINGEIIGYIVVRIENHVLAHVWEMYVNIEYRKNGIAKKLFQDAKDKLKQKNIKTIYLYVDVRNEVGIKTWNNLGFKEYMKKMKLDI